MKSRLNELALVREKLESTFTSGTEPAMIIIFMDSCDNDIHNGANGQMNIVIGLQAPVCLDQYSSRSKRTNKGGKGLI